MQTARFKKTYAFVCLILLVMVPLLFFFKGGTARVKADSLIHHYLYVFPDQSVDVYDIDNGFQLVQQISLPVTSGGRGMMVDPVGGFLYLSYHGDGGIHGTGSLLKYDLINNVVVWTKDYPFGIDSGALTPDGKTIYMPDGEAAYDGTWHVISASDGSVLGSIFTVTGNAAHNTIVGFKGQKVYLGGLNNPTFFEASTSTNKVTQTIGPLQGGIRPFTINGSESLVFTTHTGFLGFQVSDLNAGKLLYTVPVNGFSAPAGSTSAHGITISPDEKELYLIDTPNSYVHVFDISKLPGTAPTQVANIPLNPAMGGTETPCLYDCGKEGWMLHIGDGRYVVVGDSGDIIDTTTRQVAYFLNIGQQYAQIPGSGLAKWPSHLHDITPGPGLRRRPRGNAATDAAQPTVVIVTYAYLVGHDNHYAFADAQPISNAQSITYMTPSPTLTPSVTPSPSPGATLAQDTFQRANQKYWGTASDGHVWGGQANTKSAFSISNNTGQLSANGIYDAVLGPTAANAEVLVSGSMNKFSSSNIGAVLRWVDTNDWYKAYIDGGHLVVQKKVKGTYTTLKTITFAATAGKSYTIRFSVVGTTLSAKVWLTGTTEPTNWMITVNDTSLTTGYCGLRLQLQSGIVANITSFQAIGQ